MANSATSPKKGPPQFMAPTPPSTSQAAAPSTPSPSLPVTGDTALSSAPSPPADAAPSRKRGARPSIKPIEGVFEMVKTSVDTMGKEQAMDARERLVKQMVMERQEDEVKVSMMETNLRKMVIELVSPTVHKATKFHTDLEQLTQDVSNKGHRLHDLEDMMGTFQEKADQVQQFQGKLQDFYERMGELDEKLYAHKNEALGRLQDIEQAQKRDKEVTSRTKRDIDRTNTDLAALEETIRSAKAQLQEELEAQKGNAAKEVRRLEDDIANTKASLDNLTGSVWGPDLSETKEELILQAPPSLRKLDWQMKRIVEHLGTLDLNVSDLKELHTSVKDLTGVVGNIEVQVVQHYGEHRDLSARLDALTADSQAEIKHLATSVSAFHANTMHDFRKHFGEEVQQLRQLHREAEDYVKDTQVVVLKLNDSVEGTGRQIEAALKEIRVDMDGLELRRKKDKSGLQESLDTMMSRVGSAVEASEASLRGLEHVSGIVNLSLQSERMAVSLEIQDYVDRKEASYVGFNVPGGGRGDLKSVTRPNGCLDLSRLVHIPYQPKAVDFQGNSFDRSQLLTLRKQLVHVAQEVLTHGPKDKVGLGQLLRTYGHNAALTGLLGGSDAGSVGSSPTMVTSNTVPQSFGAAGLSADALTILGAAPPTEFRGGRGSVAPGAESRGSTPPAGASEIARPGSRAQPSTRGGPSSEAPCEEGWPTSSKGTEAATNGLGTGASTARQPNSSRRRQKDFSPALPAVAGATRVPSRTVVRGPAFPPAIRTN